MKERIRWGIGITAIREKLQIVNQVFINFVKICTNLIKSLEDLQNDHLEVF